MSLKPLLSFVIASFIGIFLLGFPAFLVLYRSIFGLFALYLIGVLLFCAVQETFGLLGKFARRRRASIQADRSYDQSDPLPRYGSRWTYRVSLSFFASLTASGFALADVMRGDGVLVYLFAALIIAAGTIVFDRVMRWAGLPSKL